MQRYHLSWRELDEWTASQFHCILLAALLNDQDDRRRTERGKSGKRSTPGGAFMRRQAEKSNGG